MTKEEKIKTIIEIFTGIFFRKEGVIVNRHSRVVRCINSSMTTLDLYRALNYIFRDVELMDLAVPIESVPTGFIYRSINDWTVYDGQRAKLSKR